MKTIGVIGLGQIGGSFVLSIRKRKLPFRIIGVDTSRRALQLLNFQLDSASTNWEKAVEADFVLLCLHYRPAMNLLARWPRGRLLMDVCSGKRKIVDAANRRALRFIGGHPMAGSEKSREHGWNGDLFLNTIFFLSPGKHATKQDQDFVRRLVRNLGARPQVVDPLLHDRYLAKSSHFPTVVSKLVAEANVSVPPHFLGSGYRSMIRLADTSPELLETFLESNKKNMLQSARDFQKALNRWIRQNSR